MRGAYSDPVGRSSALDHIDRLTDRPTVAPSIWQTGSCRAHFFIRKGVIVWCRDVGAPRQGVSRYV
ncbi:DUF6527 family protein [Bradyrhizobium barranii]|uniref:DUF6527 family protein n=1 Tax=Bradyrhizobium barranii TaxID=2992140 RepID=UPI003D15F616